MVRSALGKVEGKTRVRLWVRAAAAAAALGCGALAVGHGASISAQGADGLQDQRAAAQPPPASMLAEARRQPGDIFEDCPSCPEMVVVPGGEFMMGSPESEQGRAGNEGPDHRVSIRQGFAIATVETTFTEWAACVADGGCGRNPSADGGWGRGERPVINVSWEDANSYLVWLRQKTGLRYRLPSEAEWEYAARATTTTARYWGPSQLLTKDGKVRKPRLPP